MRRAACVLGRDRVNRRRMGAALVSVLVLACPSASNAEDELYLSATNKFEYRRLDQETRRDEALRNRLEISAYQGIFGAWVRLESLQISSPSFYDPYGVFEETDDPARIDVTELTKRLFTIDTESFRAEIGDVSHVFGRGLMLSVFEDEALNFDTRLEGFRGRMDHELGRASVIAGSAEGNRFRGVFVEPDGRGPLRVGASFVEAWGGETNTNIFPREQHGGGYAEVVAGPATFYGEYAERHFPGLDGVGVLGTPGHGAFAAAEVTVGSGTASVEYRDFFRFEHDYNDPPTTLRQHTWTSLNRVNGQVLADIPDDDVTGVMAQGEYAYDLFTTFQTSWSKLDRGGNDDDFFEVYGEAKGTWQEKVFLTAAASESELHFGTLFEERVGGFGELVYEFNDLNSLSMGVEWSEIQESSSVTREFEFPHEFSERIWYASWGRSPWLNLTVTYEDTTEEDPAENRDEWYTVFAEISVADNHDLNLSFGSEKGGWKCTGGVCFFEPEFEGLKVKWVSRF